MEEVIIKFKYNKKEYIITKTEKKDFKFYYIENGNLNKNLNNEERDLLIQVLDSVRIRPEYSIYLKKRKVNGREYFIYYDRKTKLHWWKPVGNFQDNEQDHIFLNYLYNNCKTVLHEESEKDNIDETPVFKEPSKFINLVYKNSKAIIIINVIAIISMNALSAYKDFCEKKERERAERVKAEIEKSSTYREQISSGQDYDFKDIEQAIDSNTKLNDGEKKLFKNLQFVFDEDHEYMNIELIKERISTVDINYILEHNEDLGEYYWIDNYINIYYSESLEDADLRVVIHEFGHINQLPSHHNYHKELANEIWGREVIKRLIDDGLIEEKNEYTDSNGVLTEYGVGYNLNLKLYYCFLKLLTPEERKKLLYQGDFNWLASRLAEMDNDLDIKRAFSRAYNLIDDINELENNRKPYFEQEIYDEINYYYELVHGEKIDEDLSNVMNFFDEYDSKYKDWGSMEKIMDFSQHDLSLRKALAYTFGWEDNDELTYIRLNDGNSVPESLFYGDSLTTFYFENENGENKIIEITPDLKEKFKQEYRSLLRRESEKQDSENQPSIKSKTIDGNNGR